MQCLLAGRPPCIPVKDAFHKGGGAVLFCIILLEKRAIYRVSLALTSVTGGEGVTRRGSPPLHFLFALRQQLRSNGYSR